MAITDLPQEILDEIIGNFDQGKLRRRSATANLTSCALTCKTFLSPCQRRLFSTIQLLANTPAQRDRVKELASIIQRPSCPIGSYVRQLHMYFGGTKQTKANMGIVFPSILPLLSNVQLLTVDGSGGKKLDLVCGLLSSILSRLRSDGQMLATDVRGCIVHDYMQKLERNWDITLSNETFLRFLRSSSLTTLAISKIGFPGLLGKCTHVKSLRVRGVEFGFGKTLNSDFRPRIESLSCEVSLSAIRYLIPDFCTEREGEEKVASLPMVDLSNLRQLILSPEFCSLEDVTQHLINYTADTVEELDCNAVIFSFQKLKPMPYLRTLTRWFLFSADASPRQAFNQLCDFLTHCTTTCKAIRRITINLATFDFGFDEFMHFNWPSVDDIFEIPPPALKEFTLGVGSAGQGEAIRHEDRQIALNSMREQRMPHLAKMASAGPDVFKFSFIAL